MNRIETNATMQIGRLIREGPDRWRVTCADCWIVGRVWMHGDYPRVAAYLRDDGWTETHGIWTCPECSREGADDENVATRV